MTTNLLQVDSLEAKVLELRRAHLHAELECRLRRIEVERMVGDKKEGAR